jgi:hypothetical protein
MLHRSATPNLPVQFPFTEFVLKLPLRRTTGGFPTPYPAVLLNAPHM